MSTRFNTGAERNFGQSPVTVGYENVGTGSPDIEIPSCGVEDVDVAMFNLFDKEIVPEVVGHGSPVTKVPVIFAAGEKWALLKNNRPIRDRNNALILPLITVMRTEVTQNNADDVNGRGISQQVGELVVRRRLDKSDAEYQSLINRLLVPNQDNLMVNEKTATTTQPYTSRRIGSLASAVEAKDGAYLYQDRLNNVIETIVVPTPQFYTAKYQITIWTQYMQHSNQVIEKIFASLLPQGQCWKLTTPKGYWFVARLEDGSLSSENSFDDMSQQERFIKHNFDITVPAYFFATKSPGSPVPVKRYVSCPVITFESDVGYDYQESKYVIGSDDPTLPMDTHANTRRDQRSIGWRTQKVYPSPPDDGSYVDPATAEKYNDPAVKGKNVFVRSSHKKKGETVYSGNSMGAFDIMVGAFGKK